MPFFTGTLAAIFGTVLFASTFASNIPTEATLLRFRGAKNAAVIVTRIVGVWFFLLGLVIVLTGFHYSH